MRSPAQIRNVVLVGHNGSGKTSLAEALLFRAGVITRPGTIEKGSTALDNDPEERERQQSVSLSLASFDWNDHRINLLDTPGYADFRGEALLGMAAADLAVFVIDGVAGVQSQDVVLWRHAAELGLPRIIFVNKLDRERSSFDRTLAQVRQVFGSHADPTELPIGAESSFHGVTDVLTHHAFVYDSGQAEPVEVPAELADQERAEHEHLVEDVIELDDDLLEQYLSGDEPSPDQLEHLLHDAVDRALAFPVLCGSATTPIGADQLVDFICRVGPAPGDRGPAIVEAADETVDIAPDPHGRPLAFVFKTTIDEFLGQISMLKVLSGTIRVDDTLVNTRSGTKERLHHLASLVGGAQTHVGSVTAGDIVVVTKLADTRTGDTLAPDGTPVTVPVPALPQPVYGVAIAAAKQSDEDRLATTLHRLVIEDPTLAVRHDDTTGQTVLSGGGETHVRVALSRIERAGVQLVVDDVRVAYRSRLAAAVEVEGKYKKQSGGHGQFGVATVRFEPLPPGSGFQFDSEVTGGVIPKNLVPAVGAGVDEAMARGANTGFPIVDLRAVCTGGKHHSVDSSEMSFKMAGSLALREAITQVGIDVLEPVSEVNVRVPAPLQGDVLGDLNARRAQVLGTVTDEVGVATVQALVPTAEILRYAIDLRSLSGGSGSFEV
ncbi:MAG TPA: elongation factor G, partial [Ilumatobacteraceae bacterium]|nr:elongation factor G [Ilumatobacteraceae bacterium]